MPELKIPTRDELVSINNFPADEELMEIPELGVAIKIRGCRTVREVMEIQNEIRLRASAPDGIPVERGGKLLRVIYDDLKIEEYSLSLDEIASVQWLTSCVTEPAMPYWDWAQFAYRTGFLVERITTRLLEKSLVIPRAVEEAKNGSRAESALPTSTTRPISTSLPNLPSGG